MFIKDGINPEKLYTFGNVKLMSNVGLNCMSNHDYIVQLTKKTYHREVGSDIYTNFGLIPIHINEISNLKQHSNFLMRNNIYYSF